MQPLLGCYQHRALPLLSGPPRRETRPVEEIVAAIEPVLFEVDDPEELFDVDTPDDLLQAAAMLDRRRTRTVGGPYGDALVCLAAAFGGGALSEREVVGGHAGGQLDGEGELLRGWERDQRIEPLAGDGEYAVLDVRAGVGIGMAGRRAAPDPGAARSRPRSGPDRRWPPEPRPRSRRPSRRGRSTPRTPSHAPLSANWFRLRPDGALVVVVRRCSLAARSPAGAAGYPGRSRVSPGRPRP